MPYRTYPAAKVGIFLYSPKKEYIKYLPFDVDEILPSAFSLL